MISKCINRRLLPMKMHYFLQFGGITSIVAFMPTLAKQLGYSARTVGLIYTFFSVLNVLAKPISGIVVDNFPVKRVVFLSAILSCGLMVVMLNFIQVLPTKNAMHLSCDTNETILYICSFHDDNNAQSSLPKCDKDLSNLLESITVSVTCQLTCEHRNELFREEMCMSWNVFDYCSTPNNTITYRHTLDFFNVSLLINKANLVESTSNFKVKSIQLKEKEVLLPVCQRPVTIMCEMDCSNNVISKSSIDPKIEGSIFESHQFWEFVVIMSLFYIGTSITCSLNDPICFDLLGNKPEDYGKQRCWGSISAGLFSAIGGLLIDYFSEGDLYKNYAPIYYLCLIIMLCDFFIAYRIKITENVASENTWSDVLRLLTDSNVILYIAWIIVMGICSSMIWYYLFWHMEDMTKKYHSDAYPWIKTIEGGATFVQCMGGEMPFLFLSGRIIKLIGYGNCMSLCLLVFAVRFYLYAIIQNPIWILPVELTNGITFGLYHAVLMAYAKIIVPPNSVATLVGISGALFEGVGISIGNLIAGYSYEHFGGVQTFQLFSCGSLMMFVLHVVLFIKFGKMNAVQAAATPADHTSARWTENGERSQVVSNPEQIYIHT